MTDIPSSELFENFGFVPQENGLWRFFEEFELSDSMMPLMGKYGHSRSSLTIIEERQDGRYFGYVFENHAKPEDEVTIPDTATYFQSRDPRDMIALAFDGKAHAYNEATGNELEGGFDSKDLYVTRPFRTEADYFDYTYTEGAKEPFYRLKSPSSEYGADYGEWRDSFCENLLQANRSPGM